MLAQATNRDLQAILLLNEHMDIPHYDAVQADIIQRLTRSHPHQIGFFSAYSSTLDHERRRVIPIFIHSKVTMADDVCLSIGSANLDGASLHGGRPAAPGSPPPARDSTDHRSG